MSHMAVIFCLPFISVSCWFSIHCVIYHWYVIDMSISIRSLLSTVLHGRNFAVKTEILHSDSWNIVDTPQESPHQSSGGFSQNSIWPPCSRACIIREILKLYCFVALCCWCCWCFLTNYFILFIYVKIIAFLQYCVENRWNFPHG